MCGQHQGPLPVRVAIEGYYHSGLDWRYQKVVGAEKALRQRHIPAGANTVPMTEALENDLRDLGSRALSLADEILDASMYGQWSPYNM